MLTKTVKTSKSKKSKKAASTEALAPTSSNESRDEPQTPAEPEQTDHDHPDIKAASPRPADDETTPDDQPTSLFADEDGSSDAENPASSANTQLGTITQIGINQKFAKKFEKRKNAEELARAEKILAREDDDDSSDAESEDSEAELLNEAVSGQIMDVLAKIR